MRFFNCFVLLCLRSGRSSLVHAEPVFGMNNKVSTDMPNRFDKYGSILENTT